MMRKVTTIAVLATALMAGAKNSAFVNRVVSSARTFEHNFCDLKKSEKSFSTMERLVFSLVLTVPTAKSRT